MSLCLQIPAEESEDEAAAGEERPDTRLSDEDTAGGSQEGSKDRSKEGAVTEETDGDGQREGQEQLDQTVTAPRDPREGHTHSDLGICIWGRMSGLVLSLMCRIQRDFPAAERRYQRKELCCVHMSTEVRPGRSDIKEAFVLEQGL